MNKYKIAICIYIGICATLFFLNNRVDADIQYKGYLVFIDPDAIKLFFLVSLTCIFYVIWSAIFGLMKLYGFNINDEIRGESITNSGIALSDKEEELYRERNKEVIHQENQFGMFVLKFWFLSFPLAIALRAYILEIFVQF